MYIYLIKKEEIISLILPTNIAGSYWLVDKDKNNERRNLINIEGINNEWILKSNFDTKIVTTNGVIDNISLKDYQYYSIKTNDANYNYLIYCFPSYDNTYVPYLVKDIKELFIGRDDSNNISLSYPLISPKNTRLSYTDGKWLVEDQASQFGTYVNGKRITSAFLNNGDIIFIMGLKIIPLNNVLLINNLNNTLKCNGLEEQKFIVPEYKGIIKSFQEDMNLYEDGDYFFRSPRFVTSIVTEKLDIDGPPTKEPEKDKPMMYTLGPMMTMGMTSAVTGLMAVNNVMNNNLSITSALPTLVISGSMLLTMIFWPALLQSYERREKRRRERKRQDKYLSYLKYNERKIDQLKKHQAQIIMNNNANMQECQNIIFMRKRNLWERKVENDDFLSFRVGVGNVDLDIDLNCPKEHFSVEDDNLNDAVLLLSKNSEKIEDVPISFSLTSKNNLVIIGQNKLRSDFLNNLILQLVTFQSYDDLKLVFLIENDDKMWNDFKILPHCWNNEKDMRFFATDYDEMSKISFYLESIFYSRKYKDENGKQTENDVDYHDFAPYFVIVTNCIKKSRNLEIINQILKEKRNLGFSIIVLNEGLTHLPNECSNYIILDERESAIVENDLNINKQIMFSLDKNDGVNTRACFQKLANIPIKMTMNTESLTTSLSFLEMYNVGKIEQLNSLNRWKSSDPIHSLIAPIGVHKNGEIFFLDLHEKFHGPHGLIAGMTGSGKSEFIITYLLSMAVNYSPNEVAFILIDYKGGGLAGAFENADLNVKLPHIAGTITNLDTNDLKRALSSIESELRKRQIIFNETRDKLNESSIDIYKYQKAYRDHLVNTPIPHLFIVCDEFAELKKQQPDFMDELISVARIGRSLGIHLILATQKPSGVVNDQIWSNSKFKVCLKVQERSDSMEVIQRPDAVMLKNAGRFYLQVGYNDLFAIGQAAWCGAQYYPSDKLRKKIDKSVSVINNIGNVVKSVDDVKNVELVSQGEELQNIVNYLTQLAKVEKITVKQLWLDKIPDEIFVGKLKEKYKYVKEKFVINPIIGEYDDPHNQRQELLTLPITNGGNTMIYGITGSGKDLLLTTLIYSSIIEYNAEELNVYIMDFGSESLRVFNEAPQVGDVVFVNETEKVTNLFKTINDEIEKRKKLFVDYNGDYRLYLKNSGKTLPLILVILNNYDVFVENYEDFVDLLISLTREGNRYGINFVITSASVTGMRYKLSQNFKQQLVLQLSDTSDYVSILGNVNGLYPSKIKGRGILRLGDNVYEFQTAYPYDWQNLNEYLKIVCQKLKQYNNKEAKKIAILPDVVSRNIVKQNIGDLSKLPIGIDKETLTISTYDIKNRYTTVIAAQELEMCKPFVYSLFQELTMILVCTIMIIDTESLLKDSKLNATYINKNFDGTYLSIENYINKVASLPQELMKKQPMLLCAIIGISNFVNALSVDNKAKFNSLMKKAETIGNVRFIFVDSINGLKKIEYNDFYRDNVDSNYGIWIGSGINEQFVLKFSTNPRSTRQQISEDFGFVIERGEPKLIKLIDFLKGDQNE